MWGHDRDCHSIWRDYETLENRLAAHVERLVEHLVGSGCSTMHRCTLHKVEHPQILI